MTPAKVAFALLLGAVLWLAILAAFGVVPYKLADTPPLRDRLQARPHPCCVTGGAGAGLRDAGLYHTGRGY